MWSSRTLGKGEISKTSNIFKVKKMLNKELPELDLIYQE